MYLTLREPVAFEGIGLHSGSRVQITIRPARAGRGIFFRRTDVDAAIGVIPARFDRVTDLRLCTRLSNEHGVSVGTVEHVMAALSGCGISDAIVDIDGPEVPIMDGSAADFVEGFLRAGVAETRRARRAIRIFRPIEVRRDGKRAVLLPAARFSARFEISFADRAIGEQAIELDLTGGAFVEELAWCRTFGHLVEVEALRRMGLARGGSLENAIVIENGRVLNPEGLRHAEEFVRHKVLDAVGDLALAGAPIIGRYVGVKAGHEMTNLLLRELFARPADWGWCELGAGQSFDLRSAQPVERRAAFPMAV